MGKEEPLKGFEQDVLGEGHTLRSVLLERLI